MMGIIGYSGPCPPAEHTYTFALYAVDKSIGNAEGAANSEVYNAIKDNIIEKTTLKGHYGG